MKTFNEFISEDFNQLSIDYKYHPKTKGELEECIAAEIKIQGPEADLNTIDTSAITDMSNIFDASVHDYTKDFNGDISNWNVSSVTNTYAMFYNCDKFNCDISQWNVSKVTHMSWMFYGCKEFDQDLNGWDVSHVNSMSNMFGNCDSFNHDLSKWDVSNVTDMFHMFLGCIKFNQDLSKWDVSSVTDMYHMFIGCPIRKEYKPKFK